MAARFSSKMLSSMRISKLLGLTGAVGKSAGCIQYSLFGNDTTHTIRSGSACVHGTIDREPVAGLFHSFALNQQSKLMPETCTRAISSNSGMPAMHLRCTPVGAHLLPDLAHFSTKADEVHKGSAQSADASASTEQESTSASNQEAKLPPLIADVHYEGPLSKTHKLLKMISISNTAIACAAAPVIMMYADISYVSRVGLSSSLVLFGMLTTGALHWITHPYVHELKFTASTQQIDVRTTTLLGIQRWHSFHLSDVQPLPWDRPVATFMAKGHFYYIDVFSFPDRELLKRLTPDEASIPAGYKDDEDD